MDDDKPSVLRRFVTVVVQILVAAFLIAAIGGLIGFAVVHFAHWGGAATGFGWGMCLAGALIALVTGQSGSPSENFAGGRWTGGGGAAANYWSESSALPQSPLQIVLGAILAFVAGIGVFLLFGY